MKVFRLTIISILLVLLAGCGFHLRGKTELPASMQPLYIDGVPQFSAIAVELRRTLRGNDIEVVDNINSAQAILRLANVRTHRRVLTVSGSTAKVREYELYYGLQVTVLSRDGNVLLPAKQLRQIRDYVYDENSVLGKSSEEAQLIKDMQSDLVNQVLRRLQAKPQG